MRIAKIEDFHTDGGTKVWSFLKITTDEGLVGWSEFNDGILGSFGLTPLLRKLCEYVIGLDPLAINALTAKLYAMTRVAAGGINAQAAAAIENACLDIKGKALGVPVYELFGGALRERVPIYWSHCGMSRVVHGERLGTPPLRNLDDVKALGQEAVRRGFKALKTNLILFDEAQPRMYRPGHGAGPGHPDRNLEPRILAAMIDQLAAFRDGVGPQTGLMIDLNFNFRPEALLRIAKAVEPIDLTWLEIDLYEPRALALIRQSTTTPIASLEAIYGRGGYLPYFENYAVDTAIVDPLWNGFSEAMKIASLADTFELNVAPHTFCSPFNTLISTHFAAAIPNLRIMEHDVDIVPWHHDFFGAIPQIENGEVLVPKKPGWGAEIDEEAIRAHPPWPRAP